MLKIKYISNLLLSQVITLNAASCNPGTSSYSGAPVQTEAAEQKEIAVAAQENTQASSSRELAITEWRKTREEIEAEYDRRQSSATSAYNNWQTNYKSALSRLHIQANHNQEMGIIITDQGRYNEMSPQVLNLQRMKTNELILRASTEYKELYQPLVQIWNDMKNLEFALFVNICHSPEEYNTKVNSYNSLCIRENERHNLLRERMAIVTPQSLISEAIRREFETTFTYPSVR